MGKLKTMRNGIHPGPQKLLVAEPRPPHPVRMMLPPGGHQDMMAVNPSGAALCCLLLPILRKDREGPPPPAPQPDCTEPEPTKGVMAQ